MLDKLGLIYEVSDISDVVKAVTIHFIAEQVAMQEVWKMLPPAHGLAFLKQDKKSPSPAYLYTVLKTHFEKQMKANKEQIEWERKQVSEYGRAPYGQRKK